MMLISKKKNKGQGMTEYLIIVALIAVGTIGMVRTVGKNLQGGFGTVANALNGQKRKVETEGVETNASQRKTLGDFQEGVGSTSGGSKGSAF